MCFEIERDETCRSDLIVISSIYSEAWFYSGTNQITTLNWLAQVHEIYNDDIECDHVQLCA